MHRAILLFGYPGSGKGTQGKILNGLPGFHHVAMGDIFRGMTRDNPHHERVTSLISGGDLVPSELVLDIFEHHVTERKIPEDEFILLDGLPRSKAQAQALKSHVNVVKIFKLSVYDENMVIKRLRSRALKEGRADDSDEVISHRLDVYKNQTESSITAYPGSILTRIYADQPIFDVHLDIMNALHKMRDIYFK